MNKEKSGQKRKLWLAYLEAMFIGVMLMAGWFGWLIF